MTFERLLSDALSRYDAAAEALRACLADPEHTNNESRQFKDALTESNDAMDAIWKLKQAVQRVKNHAARQREKQS